MVGTDNFDFSGVLHRARLGEARGENTIPDRDEIGGTPEAGPTSSPPGDLARRRTILGESLEEDDNAIEPCPGHAIRRVCYHRKGEFLLRETGRSSDEALKTAVQDKRGAPASA